MAGGEGMDEGVILGRRGDGPILGRGVVGGVLRKEVGEGRICSIVLPWRQRG